MAAYERERELSLRGEDVELVNLLDDGEDRAQALRRRASRGDAR